MKTIVVAVATAAALVSGSSPATNAPRLNFERTGSVKSAPSATLAKAVITFNVYDGGDDKDDDSQLRITVFSVFGSGFIKESATAGFDTFGGRFADGSIHHIPLAVQGTTSLDALKDLKLRLEFEPNGDDTFKFVYTLKVYFNDGTVLSKTAPAVLSDKQRVLEF